MSKRTDYSEGNVNFSIYNRYRIEEVLGKGSYGTVCSASEVDCNSSNEPNKIAIKKVTDIFRKEVLLKRAVRELKLMNHFKGHRNIVNLIDVDLIYQKPFDGLYCYQELVEYDLAKVIYSSIQFSDFHIQSFLYQILCGLNYIHSADVIHRDLKPGNILVTDQGNLKICDFGLARGFNTTFMSSNPLPITNYVATRWYRAPELILSNRNYNKSVDIWALGCILCELYGRRPIFVGKDQLHQIHEIMKVLGTPPTELTNKLKWKYTPIKPIYSKVSWQHIYPYAHKQVYSLMERLLRWDPHERITIEEIFNHEYLQEVRDSTRQSESVCDTLFDFKWENQYHSLKDLQTLLVNEINLFKTTRIAKT